MGLIKDHASPIREPRYLLLISRRVICHISWRFRQRLLNMAIGVVEWSLWGFIKCSTTMLTPSKRLHYNALTSHPFQVQIYAVGISSFLILYPVLDQTRPKQR